MPVNRAGVIQDPTCADFSIQVAPPQFLLLLILVWQLHAVSPKEDLHEVCPPAHMS